MAQRTVLTDEHLFNGAHFSHGTPIRTYDDGMGPLWLYRDAGGLIGIVRAMSWEEAWETVEDEILHPIPEEDLEDAFDGEPDEDGYRELAEGYSFQSNSAGTGIVFHDLNGESLDLLTDEHLTDIGIVLDIEAWEGGV